MKLKRDESEKLFEKAKTYFPGGVNSPVRAFRSVGGTPIFMEKGQGCRLTDADGNTYIDFCASWGPLITGHAHPDIIHAISETAKSGTTFGAPTRLENELASLILSNNKFIKKLRFVSSGTEAVMSAVRLARGYSGKNKIVKFEGCYHGHIDSLLVKAGSGLVTFGSSSSAGVPEDVVKQTITIPLDNELIIDEVLEKYADDIAAVIIEPIPANNGLLLQRKEFLEHLRSSTIKHNVLLIFDEVISGFRVGFEGAAGYYGIQPDIITYGKIIGGGMPVGAYGANADIMSCISPEGNVYQAGTLSGNPLAMAAGKAQLSLCLQPGFYEKLTATCESMVNVIEQHVIEKGIPLRIFRVGSIFWFAFTQQHCIRTSEAINPDSMHYFRQLHAHLLQKGIYFGPSGYEVGFIGSAHRDEDIKVAENAIIESLDEIFPTL